MTTLVRAIELDLLDRRADARVVDLDQVQAIAGSMGDVGQLSAIRVRRKDGGRFEIVAGVHRVEACRSLGLAEVDAIVEDIGDLFAELTMIDENLCRSDLGPSDRARQTARRKAIYEEIHPETAHGATGRGGYENSRQVGDSSDGEPAPRFTEDTAQASGKSERTVQRDAERGEKISPDVLDLVRGTDLDTGTYLDGLKRFSPDQQRMLVERDLKALDERDSDTGRERARQAVGAGRVQDGDSLDYFPTPPWATRALIEDVLAPNGIDPGFDLVWEPACGEGHISGVLEEYGIQVIATDIKDYSVDGRSPPGWSGVADFLEASWGGEDEPPEWIITNPPFTGRGQDRALEFALRALDVATVGVALFVRGGWGLEGIDRYERLFRDNPPLYFCPFTERVPVHEGRWEPDGSTDMAYVWLVWLKGDSAPRGPISLVKRIPPGRRVERTRPDDIERFTAHPVRAPAAGRTNYPEIPDSSNSPAMPADTASPALTFAEAKPILEARYATEDGQALADELGIPIGTLRTWAFRLKLTRKGRIAETNLARIAAAKEGSP